jgi:hypothetical protein
VLPPSEDTEVEEMSGNVPIAVLPEATDDGITFSEGADTLPEIGSNAPVADTSPDEEAASDLESIRDELKRRNDEDNEQ